MQTTPALPELSSAPQLHASNTDEPAPTRKRRICDGCGRPGNTCLCAAIPSPPLRLTGHVMVLRHPHEKGKNLATVPVLGKCLGDDMTVVHNRKLPQVWEEHPHRSQVCNL